MRRVGILWTGLTLPHFCACPNPGTGFPSSYVVVFWCSVSLFQITDCLFCWNYWPSLFRDDCSLCWYWCELVTITGWRWLIAVLILVWIVDHHCLEMIVRFVDIGVNWWPSLFRGVCLLCWYSWNYWPSLFRGDSLICWYLCELLTITV